MCVHVHIYSDPTVVTDLCCSLLRRRFSAIPSRVQLQSLPRTVNRTEHSATVRVSSGIPCRWDEPVALSQCSQLPPQLHAGDPSGFSFLAISFASTETDHLSEYSTHLCRSDTRSQRTYRQVKECHEVVCLAGKSMEMIISWRFGWFRLHVHFTTGCALAQPYAPAPSPPRQPTLGGAEVLSWATRSAD